jgi:hypothetical protein
MASESGWIIATTFSQSNSSPRTKRSRHADRAEIDRDPLLYLRLNLKPFYCSNRQQEKQPNHRSDYDNQICEKEVIPSKSWVAPISEFGCFVDSGCFGWFGKALRKVGGTELRRWVAPISAPISEFGCFVDSGCFGWLGKALRKVDGTDLRRWVAPISISPIYLRPQSRSLGVLSMLSVLGGWGRR